MGSSSVLVATFCILACICSLPPVAMERQRTLHLSHYSNEIRGGPNRTLLLAAGTNADNLTAGAGWGSVLVYDNMLRAGANTDSQLLGRVAGTAVGVVKPSPSTDGFTRVQVQMEHIFEGASEYSGSSISVIGIFYTTIGPWECVVPGGTGHFRGYTGYGVAEELSDTIVDGVFYLVYRWDFYLHKYK